MRQVRARYLILVAAAVSSLTLCAAHVRGDERAELEAALKRVDMRLCEQTEADVRGLLDKLLQTYWKPGQTLSVSYDTGGHGAICAMWLRGYEMLGEERYLQAGLDSVDAILQTQREDGMFPAAAILRRGGRSEARARARLEDEYNFVQFALVCYAYKLSKDREYLHAALKHAETLRSCQDPGASELWQGPWPHTYHGQVRPERGEGYKAGYMLNDYAAYDGMRTMIMAYKLSGEKKYIDPRNFNRFACPMLTYFSAAMNKDVGLNMIREAYDWLKSVERRDGWAYKYTYDGQEAFAGAYRNMLRPDVHGRSKVVLDGVEKVLQVTENGGIEALRSWYGPRPVKYNPRQYMAARIESARRVTDEDLTVRLWSLSDHELVLGKYLERVRQRPAKSPSVAIHEGWVWLWWRDRPDGRPPQLSVGWKDHSPRRIAARLSRKGVHYLHFHRRKEDRHLRGDGDSVAYIPIIRVACLP